MVSVMDAQYEIEVDARTAEISLEVTGHEVVEDGLTHLQVNASNNAENWQPSPLFYPPIGSPGLRRKWKESVGREERAAVIDCA